LCKNSNELFKSIWIFSCLIFTILN
jgi:hypothetical protein